MHWCWWLLSFFTFFTVLGAVRRRFFLRNRSDVAQLLQEAAKLRPSSALLGEAFSDPVSVRQRIRPDLKCVLFQTFNSFNLTASLNSLRQNSQPLTSARGFRRSFSPTRASSPVVDTSPTLLSSRPSAVSSVSENRSVDVPRPSSAQSLFTQPLNSPDSDSRGSRRPLSVKFPSHFQPSASFFDEERTEIFEVLSK